jgi:NAD(P)-dependent dehydrogenase (short-subunit alcohol dehydrogenase family)
LVHAAGAIVVRPLRDVDAADWDRLFALHVKAPHALTLAAWPRMAPGASIVFVSSISAVRATPDAAAYSATKAAQRNLAATFATAMAPDGIRVNCVCPGLIDTPMTDAMNVTLSAMRGQSVDAVAAGRAAGIPMGRAGTPEEVAASVRYLLSDDAAYVTGSTLTIAGGVWAGSV